MKIEQIKQAYKLKENIPLRFVAKAVSQDKEMLLNYIKDNNPQAVNNALIKLGYNLSVRPDVNQIDNLDNLLKNILVLNKQQEIQAIINEFNKLGFNPNASNWTTDKELNQLLIENFKIK